jgi:hypothetical protein
MAGIDNVPSWNAGSKDDGEKLCGAQRGGSGTEESLPRPVVGVDIVNAHGPAGVQVEKAQLIGMCKIKQTDDE